MGPSMLRERLVNSGRVELRVAKEGFLNMIRFSSNIEVDVAPKNPCAINGNKRDSFKSVNET